MAISITHWNALASRAGIPWNASVLEIGEANIYDDATVDRIRELAEKSGDQAVIEAYNAACRSELCMFDLVKVGYLLLFGATQVASIDLHGTDQAYKFDLNRPVNLGRQFELVMNHGTAEHVFHVANVFKVMHDHCVTGGLMVHEVPFTGWVDHGFYTIQPTLFWDLAAANSYQIEYVAVERLGDPQPLEIVSREHVLELAERGGLPDNAMLFVALRKGSDNEFFVPIQGYYADSVSEEAREAWSKLR